MIKTELRLLKNFLNKNLYKVLIFTIVIFIILFFIIKNLMTIKISGNSIELYKELYYFMMFLYIPIIYLSMEYIFRSKKVNFLRFFAIRNTKLVNYLLISFFIKSLFIYLLELIVISVFILKDISFFYAVLTYITIYHLMFFAISVFVYGYISIFITDDSYSNIRKGLSGGWTDEKLAPFLFAPAIVFTFLNFANIIVAKLLEKSFFDYQYSISTVVFTLLAVFAFLIFKGRQLLSINLLTNYAIISEFKNLYMDGSYIVEKKFPEESFIKKVFTKLSFNIIKDLKILKRGFRLQALFVYFSFIVIILIENGAVGEKILFLAYFLLYLIVFTPIFKLYYPPIELKHKGSIYAISNKDIFISKIVASFVYLLPLIIYSFIFSIYYNKLELLVFPVFFIIQTSVVYFISNKLIANLGLRFSMFLLLFYLI